MAVSVILVRALVEALARRGIPGEELLVRANLAPNLLEAPWGRIEMHEYERAAEIALDLSGDPALGLHMGEHASPAALGLAGQLATNCHTLRDCIDVLLTYYPLIIDFAPPVLSQGAKLSRLRYPFQHSTERLRRLCAEFGLARFVLFARAFAGPAVEDVEVWFEHKAPEYAAEYLRVFGGPVRCEMSETALVFPSSLLEARQFHWDPVLHQVLRNEADRALANMHAQPTAERLRSSLLAQRPWKRAGLSDAARWLGITVRGLRRQLLLEGTSFRAILDDAQRQRALILGKDPMRSTESIAEELGYSELSSYCRAFKRWTGSTPQHYRTRFADHCEGA
ncbi:MAG: AraC family transcriptional regulator ligand-binding domain-containing protein [Myxococcales bacterium]